MVSRTFSTIIVSCLYLGMNSTCIHMPQSNIQGVYLLVPNFNTFMCLLLISYYCTSIAFTLAHHCADK